MSDHRDKTISFECRWGKNHNDEECKEINAKLLDLFTNLPAKCIKDFFENYKSLKDILKSMK